MELHWDIASDINLVVLIYIYIEKTYIKHFYIYIVIISIFTFMCMQHKKTQKTRTNHDRCNQNKMYRRLRCIVAQAAGFTRTGASLGDKTCGGNVEETMGCTLVVNIKKTNV